MKVVWHPALRRDELEFISLAKPWQVFSQMGAVANEDTIVEAEYVRSHQLIRAHDSRYVGAIIDGQVTNGFGKINEEAMDQLPQIMAANGVMCRAVIEAINDYREPVFAPVGGFHHAKYDSAGGYCTFNGLHVSIANARLNDLAQKVLIIDGDAHYGDGTNDITQKLCLSGITNLTNTPARRQTLNDITLALIAEEWDLVIYQAGADSHKDDPYGEGYLDDHAWECRDELVFQHCARTRTPLVFNLAGGYGPRTVELHLKTVKAARLYYKSARRTAPPSQ